jgi:hypothetical protein
MYIHRTNPKGAATAEEAFAAMQRHDTRQHPAPASPPMPRPPAGSGGDDGDILYGGRAIAQYLFGSSDDRTRRRVFVLAGHYLARKEKAGFFKLKAALCLSKTQWRKFLGFE